MKKWFYCAVLVLIATMANAKPKVALEMQLDTAGWMHSYAASTNEVITIIKALGISGVAFSVQVEDESVFAIAKIETTLPDAQAIWLSHTNIVQLQPLAGNEFRFLVPEEKNNPKIDALQDIRLRFSGGTILVAGKDHLDDAGALKAGSGTLLRGTAKVDLLFKPVCKVVDEIVDGQEDDFGKAMIAGMWGSVRKQIEAINDIPATRFSVVSPRDGSRQMALEFTYKEAATAKEMETFFANPEDAWKNPALTDWQLSLLQLVDSPNFKASAAKGNTLAFVYVWEPVGDGDMLQLIGKSILGGLKPSSRGGNFPINEKKTIPAPNLTTGGDFDAEQFKSDFKSALFFGYAWNHSTDFTVDYLATSFPDLLKATITNACVLTAEGENILNTERGGYFRINAHDQTATISLPLEKDKGKAEKASFTIQLTVPIEVEKATLDANNRSYEKGDQGICLSALSNSVVSLRSRNLSLRDAKVYVSDAEGDYLGQRSAFWSDTSYRADFAGIPAVVEIVSPTKTETVSITFTDLPATKEAKPEIPHAPTNSVITRYSMGNPATFVEPDMAAIAQSSMTYATNAGWKKNGYELLLPSPEGVKPKQISIKTYLAGTSQLVSHGGNGGYFTSGNNFRWELTNTNALKSATALFGEATAEFWSGITTGTANLSTNSVPLNTATTHPTAFVEHNVVWIGTTNGIEILTVRACDATGRQLKKANRTSSKSTTVNGVRNSSRGFFFWGKPTKTTVQYATRMERATVPFQMELKPGGLGDIPAAKKTIVPFEELLEIIAEVDRHDQSTYGCLLAANYYASNYKKEPRKSISLEVAQSDISGAAIFGYEATPCKGYHFKKLPTAQEVKREMKPEEHEWNGGTFKTPRISGVVLALPVDKNAPAILACWGTLYVNYSDCSTLEHIDNSMQALKTAGWIRVR